ncbi:unnamed protein product [Periconia digitata]|uniref:Uncharacterized protein n=1 Tax=Periconia digitata TaxID=1303443 RepID=A0A9W4UD72_9PLEO|nr:unnamed protein product [Periconia digitata]
MRSINCHLENSNACYRSKVPLSLPMLFTQDVKSLEDADLEELRKLVSYN